MRNRPYGGSHPEESYVPATRARMFLDRPTSHGGWPEGEYDPPVRDRIYGWYKSMGMMPEADAEYAESQLRGMIREIHEEMQGEEEMPFGKMTPEQRRDKQKATAGTRAGYVYDPFRTKLSVYLARDIMGDDNAAAVEARQFIEENPAIAKNVWSELQVSGRYDLAREIQNLADGKTRKS